MEISKQERSDIDAMLTVWFGAPDSETFGKNREQWWGSFEDFDTAIRETLLPHHDAAANGDLDHWISDVNGGLALIILLDQVPRNMFRATARAFATDAKAVIMAQQYIDTGLDSQLLNIQRMFAYLPFEHSEDLAHQNYAVDLITALGDPSTTDYAIRHRDVIEQFGRFPHRNDFLGRTSTPEEVEFLKLPNSSF